MFTEELHHDNIIAVRQISGFASNSMTVSIYEKVGHVVVPELLQGVLLMERAFEESNMAALIRHSYNWCEKLQREYRNTYWTECIREYSVPQHGEPPIRVFYKEAANTASFITRLRNTVTGTAAQIPRTPQSVALSPQALQGAFVRAAAYEGLGGETTERVARAFIQNLRLELGR